MSIPGYTAEHSFDDRGRHYAMRRDAETQGAVVASYWADPGAPFWGDWQDMGFSYGQHLDPACYSMCVKKNMGVCMSADPEDVGGSDACMNTVKDRCRDRCSFFGWG